MAKLIPRIKLLEDIAKYRPSELEETGVYIAGKALRAKIFFDRNQRGFEKADVNGPEGAFENSGLSLMQSGTLDRIIAISENNQGKEQLNNNSPENYTSEPYGRRSRQQLKDFISIIDYEFRDEANASINYKSLTLPFVPRELNYEPSSKFVGIATMGRNTPFYQFTGSEDTLKFEIDWFAEELDRQDVINKCRWVEALSKSNAYEEAPHRVKLVWGQDDLLWRDDIWLVVDAPYTLTQFTKGYNQSGSVERIGLMPQQAIQAITLKRVSGENRTTEDILGSLSNFK